MSKPVYLYRVSITYPKGHVCRRATVYTHATDPDEAIGSEDVMDEKIPGCRIKKVRQMREVQT